VRADRVLANVAGAVLVDVTLALGARAERCLAGEIHRRAVLLRTFGLLAEIELELPVFFVVEHEASSA
jgi:hypothetical protein